MAGKKNGGKASAGKAAKASKRSPARKGKGGGKASPR